MSIDKSIPADQELGSYANEQANSTMSPPCVEHSYYEEWNLHMKGESLQDGDTRIISYVRGPEKGLVVSQVLVDGGWQDDDILRMAERDGGAVTIPEIDVTFHGITVTVSAGDPKSAYAILCKVLADAGIEFVTDTFTTAAEPTSQDYGSTRELWGGAL